MNKVVSQFRALDHGTVPVHGGLTVTTAVGAHQRVRHMVLQGTRPCCGYRKMKRVMARCSRRASTTGGASEMGRRHWTKAVSGWSSVATRLEHGLEKQAAQNGSVDKMMGHRLLL
jgi:hypothetical protein